MALTLPLQSRTLANMSERVIDNHPEFWVGFRPDAAAGYARDADGTPVLVAITVYAPTTEALRGIRLSNLQPLRATAVLKAFRQADPPSADQLRRAMPSLVELKRLQEELGLTTELVAEAAARRAEDAASPEALRRSQGEAPADFYRRVKQAHEALSLITDKPTTELAERAGVKVGTAAAWVSRASQMEREGLL